MELITESYLEQQVRLAQTGKQIVAQYDDDMIVLYIPGFGEFYGTTTISRPIIVQPNFMRVMTKSDWLMKPDQQSLEVVRLRRTIFDEMLSQAVHTRFQPDIYESEDDWKTQFAMAKVMIDWDSADSVEEEGERHYFQMGIHSRHWIDQMLQGNIRTVEDLTPFIAEQRPNAEPPYSDLMIPHEEVYPIFDVSVADRLGLDR